MLLGFGDVWVWLVYVLCVLSTLLCVVWGAFTWNREDEIDREPDEEVRHWDEEETKVEQKLT